MHREIILAILPWLAAIVACAATARLLLAICGPRLKIAELKKLSHDEAGGVQSLSFVLTLPLFVMIMLFIVQLSQITIAKIVVEYAAFAAARAAIVWIPANLGPGSEEENQIGTRRLHGEIQADGQSYAVYDVLPEGPKFSKIHFTAAMACLPICPSRDTGVVPTHPGNEALNAIQSAYRALVPSSVDNPHIAARLKNKLAYALENTAVEIEIHHKLSEPALAHYGVQPHPREFQPNEFGWQDQIYVTVVHRFALLPGPGRLLARRADARPGSDAYPPGDDEVAMQIDHRGRGDYVYPLTAQVRLSNAGQKPMLPYVQTLPLD